MKLSFAAVAGVEFLQGFKFVVHNFLHNHQGRRGTPPPVELSARGVGSIQFCQFRFDLVQIGQLPRVFEYFHVLDNALAINHKSSAFRHATHR